MGCCVCIEKEVRLTELMNNEEVLPAESKNSDGFKDLNLSSDSEISHLKDWLAIKYSQSFTESTTVYTSFNHTHQHNSVPKALTQCGVIESFSIAPLRSIIK